MFHVPSLFSSKTSLELKKLHHPDRAFSKFHFDRTLRFQFTILEWNILNEMTPKRLDSTHRHLTISVLEFTSLRNLQKILNIQKFFQK